jgi:two-component system, NarL family, response regulator LiaR
MSDPENKPIRLLICDDQDIVCEGLRAIFSSVSQIEVVGVANNGVEAVEQTRRLQPDLVLMDLKMPKMNGIQATKAIHEQFPKVYVLVLTTYNADEWVMDAIRSGAAGYLLKDTPQEDLIKAIIDTANGHTHLDPQVAGILIDHVIHQPASSVPEPKLISVLSDREREVLRHLANGLSNTEISQTLFLTEGTVKNYVSTIFSKLEVTDRTQAALLAIRAGLVKPGNN